MSGIRFCPECLNILEPTELVDQRSLVFKCNCEGCGYQETPNDGGEIDKNDNLIYKREFNTSGATENTDPDFSLDPTMPRKKNVECPKCGYTEAAFFVDKESAEKKLLLRYICGRVDNGRPDCGYSWAEEDL